MYATEEQHSMASELDFFSGDVAPDKAATLWAGRNGGFSNGGGRTGGTLISGLRQRGEEYQQ